MRLLVGQTGGRKSVFAVQGDEAVDLGAAVPGLGSDLAAMIGAPALRDRAADAIATGKRVRLAAIEPALPVEHPPTIICLGHNYTDHIREGGYDIPDYPALFMRGRQSIIASGQPMVRPACSERLDYEAELMIVIGRGGRHIAEDRALDHVFGYTVFNDGTVRDYQRRSHQWTPGKNFDATGAIGPVVATADELPPGASGLGIESRVGDEVLQSSNTAHMIWSVAQIIATISEYTTLRPGDHIATGTPPGVGHAKKPGPRWLRPGEVIEIEIEGIGVCANPVIDEADWGGLAVTG